MTGDVYTPYSPCMSTPLNEGEALIKNLCQFNHHGLRTILAEGLDMLIRFDKQKAQTKSTRAKHARNEGERDRCG